MWHKTLIVGAAGTRPCVVPTIRKQGLTWDVCVSYSFGECVSVVPTFFVQTTRLLRRFLVLRACTHSRLPCESSRATFAPARATLATASPLCAMTARCGCVWLPRPPSLSAMRVRARALLFVWLVVSSVCVLMNELVIDVANSGLQVLPLQVPQELQEEAQPTQDPMDEGLPQVPRQGVGSGTVGVGACRSCYLLFWCELTTRPLLRDRTRHSSLRRGVMHLSATTVSSRQPRCVP